MKRACFLLVLLIFAALPAKAQFYSNDGDPGHLRWYTMETPYYQLIYPSGTDSLARVYGRLLEQFRTPVGRSFGQTPGDGQLRKMPVVLHAYNPYSNGAVGWAPRRIDLFTIPQNNGADPSPWPIQLTAHEPRHQAQFQRARRHSLGFLGYLTGEAWTPLYWQLYLSWALGEGDATVAETGLASGTRARTADFLNYYRIAFDQGDFRNWYRWRFGSYRHATPDHYALGYLSLAGARYLYGDPLITQEMMEHSRKNPFLFAAGNYRKVLKEHNGGKPFKEAFRDIQDSFNAIWQADAAARAPFMPMEQLTPDETYPVYYSSPQIDTGGTIFALRNGPLYANDIVAIRDGKVRHLRYLNSISTAFVFDPVKNRLYWTEIRPHPRWKKAGTSQVVYYDIHSGKTQDLTRGDHLYFNVQISDDGGRVAVGEYMPGGANYVVQLSTADGSVLRRTRVPDGIQAGEFGWDGEDLYLAGNSLEGYGIYRIPAGGEWEEILAPSVQKVVNVGGGDGCVEWTSDRNGTNETYRYFPENGKLFQLTNSRYGVKDPHIDGDYLYVTSLTLKGQMIFRTRLDQLKPREVNYGDVHGWVVEDSLSAQERSLGDGPSLQEKVPFSEPRRYYKWAHPMRLHSWLPLYVNYDAVKEGSMDFSYKTASLGLSGFFQNTLGTVSGMVGYGLHRDPDVHTRWRNSLHAKLVYTGIYPVIEAELDFGDRAASQYYLNKFNTRGQESVGLGVFRRKAPLLQAGLRSYVPLSWHKNGVFYGFTPQLRYFISNNMLAPDPVLWTAPEMLEGLPAKYKLTGTGTDEGNVLMHRLSASLRGYAMLAKADNAVFPRLGIGAELGASLRPSLTGIFAPNVYGYLYAYLPGFTRTQGLKLTGMVQRQISPQGLHFGEMTAGILPRGFGDEAAAAVAASFPFQWRVTADYSIPIWVGDLNIPGVAYITHFVLTPHGDLTGFSGGKLWSAGADLTASLAKLILPYDSSLGVSFSWLGGSWYEKTGQERPWSVELIFSMDF